MGHFLLNLKNLSSHIKKLLWCLFGQRFVKNWLLLILASGHTGWDSNTGPLRPKSPPITTRPGPEPKSSSFLLPS